MKNGLTKFEISKYLNVSRNKLNGFLKRINPTEDEFDGKYYTYEFINKLKILFKDEIEITVNNFKNKNQLYTLSQLSSEFGLDTRRIKEIIKFNNLEIIHFANREFYNNKTREKIIELLNEKIICSNVRNGVNGYVKFVDVMKSLNVNRERLEKILFAYNIKEKKISNILFIKNEDFEFLKSSDYNDLPNRIITSEIKDIITLPKLCLKVNTKYSYVKRLIDSGKLDLKPKKYKSIDIYDEESEDILKEYLREQPYVAKREVLTHNQLSKYLKVSRNKLGNYLQYFKPNSEEFDGKYYTYEFANKMKEFMNEHPSIRQNKVYVRELNNMEFDSRAEAYYYCYMKDHNHDIKHHPLNLYYLDSNGKKRRYEVDFMVDGKLVEIKGDIQFDENGKPFFRKKSWQEKYDCMIENNVEMILSSEFDENGIYKHMRYYFHEKYSFVKYIKELTEDINEKDIKYMSHLRQSLAKNSEMFHCIETNESYFNFEWFEILHRRVNTKSKIYGHTYIKCSPFERNSYILSKIEELRSKGLDVSWFDKNKEKYLKTENEEETIFNL